MTSAAVPECNDCTRASTATHARRTERQCTEARANATLLLVVDAAAVTVALRECRLLGHWERSRCGRGGRRWISASSHMRPPITPRRRRRSDETRVCADVERSVLQPRDDPEAGFPKTSLRSVAVMAALRTADLGCAETAHDTVWVLALAPLTTGPKRKCSAKASYPHWNGCNRVDEVGRRLGRHERISSGWEPASDGSVSCSPR
jgi:hypothetical protein